MANAAAMRAGLDSIARVGDVLVTAQMADIATTVYANVAQVIRARAVLR